MAESLKYLLVLLHVCYALATRTFNGYSVLRILPKTEHQLHYLANLAKDFDNDSSYYQKFDFWK